LPSGDYLFVITDEYSRYPIVEIIKWESATTVIPVLDKGTFFYSMINCRSTLETIHLSVWRLLFWLFLGDPHVQFQ
jgi:hypothetical protein